MRMDKCQGCGSVDVRKLECGHFYCAKCEDTFKAFQLAKEIAGGIKKEDWCEKVFCLMCQGKRKKEQLHH